MLILWGTKDVILIPRQGRRFERLIEARSSATRGLGHVPMSDDPEVLAQAIASFAERAAAPVEAQVARGRR